MKLLPEKHPMRALLAVLLFAATPTFAHHALAAKYNTSQPITLEGTVTKVAWSNPHVRLYLDAKEKGSTPAGWDLEMASPNLLFLNGWKIDTLRPGDHVTVEAYPARDGSKHAYAQKVSVTTR